MNNDATIHDKFIRKILSNKKLAVEYFKAYLPEFISGRINFSSLKQLSDTYLSDDLKKSMSDIVYSCKLKGGKNDIRISLLIEHKSFPDKNTPIQIGSYIFSPLQKQIANKEPLTLVIPVLIYHGKGKWKYQTLVNLFEEFDGEWKKFLPNFEYIYNDLGTLRDEEVARLNNKFLAASFLALKHSFEKKWVEQKAIQLLVLIGDESKSLQKSFIIYLFSRGKLKERVLDSLPPLIKDKVMNTLDLYIEKGRKKGIEEGIEKGIERGKELVVQNLLEAGSFSISKIAALVGVNESFVKKVKASKSRRK